MQAFPASEPGARTALVGYRTPGPVNWAHFCPPPSSPVPARLADQSMSFLGMPIAAPRLPGSGIQ